MQLHISTIREADLKHKYIDLKALHRPKNTFTSVLIIVRNKQRCVDTYLPLYGLTRKSAHLKT